MFAMHSWPGGKRLSTTMTTEHSAPDQSTGYSGSLTNFPEGPIY